MAAGPRAKLAAEQLRLLNLLLPKLLNGNGFYGPRLRAAGLNLPLTSLEGFMSLPFTSKSELQEDQLAHPPFGSNLTYPIEAFTRFHQTSGSTGTPMRWLDTTHSWQTLIRNWKKVFEAAGVTASDRCFFAFSFGPFLGFWTAFEAATSIGCLSIPGGGMRTLGRLQTLLENQVSVLCCTPTYAIHLGQMAHQEGIDLSASHVKKILVAGEPGGSIPTVRQTIQTLWPTARVFDHHGMTEIGPASFPCPNQPNRLHLIEPGFLVEVRDPETGQLAGEGEPGELILSNLERDGMPLLRYRTGDLVIAHTGTCECGDPTTYLEGGILGRLDDMVIIRGVNLYPAAIDAIVREFAQILEYQVLVEGNQGLSQVNLIIEAGQQTQGAEIAQALGHRLHAHFNLRIPVTHVPPGSLPRQELKAKRWIFSD